MSNLTRVNPLGWGLLEGFTSAQANQLDINLTKAINGDEGSVHAPADPVVMSGAGIHNANYIRQFFGITAILDNEEGVKIEQTVLSGETAVVTLLDQAPLVKRWVVFSDIRGGGLVQIVNGAATLQEQVYSDVPQMLVIELGATATPGVWDTISIQKFPSFLGVRELTNLSTLPNPTTTVLEALAKRVTHITSNYTNLNQTLQLPAVFSSAAGLLHTVIFDKVVVGSSFYITDAVGNILVSSPSTALSFSNAVFDFYVDEDGNWKHLSSRILGPGSVHDGHIPQTSVISQAPGGAAIELDAHIRFVRYTGVIGNGEAIVLPPKADLPVGWTLTILANAWPPISGGAIQFNENTTNGGALLGSMSSGDFVSNITHVVIRVEYFESKFVISGDGRLANSIL